MGVQSERPEKNIKDRIRGTPHSSCGSPKPHLIGKQLILQINDCRLVFAMLNAIVVSIRFILLILAGQKQVALENAALRQQLAVFKRNVPRPKVNNRDRLFWIGLYMIWQGWQSALIFVQPETVTSWHHNRFKRYWWKLSQSKQPGRPRTGAEIRKLIHTYSCAACSVNKIRM